MDRREFLHGATRMLLVLPLGRFLIQCTGDDDSAVIVTSPTQPDTSPPDAPPRLDGDNIVYTSSNTNLHSHSFSVPGSQFVSPTGVIGDTTAAQAHTHSVVVSTEALLRANAGESVKIITSSTLGHSHVFTIVKI